MKDEAAVKLALKKMMRKYKPKVLYKMPRAGVYGKRGDGDFICSFNGRYVEIETKSPNKPTNLSPSQMLNAASVLASKGLHFTVYDQETIDEVETVIKLLLDES